MTTISREQLIADESANGYLYLGRPNVSSEVVFSSRSATAGDRLSLPNNCAEDVLLRGIFAIDPTWCSFNPDGNIGNITKVQRTKATCFLKEVPKKNRKYRFAHEDFVTACKNLRAIMDKVAGAPLKHNKSLVQDIGMPQHPVIKLSHSLFQRRPAPDEASDDDTDSEEPNTPGRDVPPYGFDNWPISKDNRRKLELIEKTKEWDIVPIPVFRRVDGEWTLLSPADYTSTLPGCIVDVSFVVAKWIIGKGAEADRSFNAIPACIRILCPGPGSAACDPETTKRAREAMLTTEPLKESRLDGASAVTDSRTHADDVAPQGDIDTNTTEAPTATSSSTPIRKRNKKNNGL